MRYHLQHKHVSVLIRMLVVVMGLYGLVHSHESARAASATDYRIDTTQSKFIVHVFKSGFLRSMGHNHTIEITDFSGVAQLTPGAVEMDSLVMKAKAASLVVVDNVSASDKSKIEETMREHVLETSRYPEITFKSVHVAVDKVVGSQYQLHIIGDLSLHGVTRRILIPVSAILTEHMLKAHGEFPLQQTDYNIKPVSVAGGAIKVKNEVKLAFDIIARA